MMPFLNASIRHQMLLASLFAALKGNISRWGGETVPTKKAEQEGNDVDAHGVSFAPPPIVHKVIPRDPKPKEPITKRGKRLAEARERGEEVEANALLNIVPIDTVEFTKASQAAKFSTAKRHCIPQCFADKPWFKKMEDIEEAGPVTGELRRLFTGTPTGSADTSICRVSAANSARHSNQPRDCSEKSAKARHWRSHSLNG